MGIKSSSIPTKSFADEKKPAPVLEVKEQKLTSKNADSESHSFTIETTTMEADPESLVQPKAPVAIQQKLPEKNVEKKVEPKTLVKKPIEESSDFKIETTTVSPEMMKALAGEDDEEKPTPPKAPEPAKAPEAPKP